jgi:hypothetical protein
MCMTENIILPQADTSCEALIYHTLRETDEKGAKKWEPTKLGWKKVDTVQGGTNWLWGGKKWLTDSIFSVSKSFKLAKKWELTKLGWKKVHKEWIRHGGGKNWLRGGKKCSTETIAFLSFKVVHDHHTGSCSANFHTRLKVLASSY